MTVVLIRSFRSVYVDARFDPASMVCRGAATIVVEVILFFGWDA